MKKSLLFLVLSLMLATSLINVFGHGGETHATDTDDTSNDRFSLTLEQIYVITFVMAIIMAFILEYRGIIKDRGLVYKLIGFGLFFLTADYIIFREYFA